SRIGEAPEGIEDERDGVVGSDRPVEQIAGHDDEVDLLVPGDGDDLVEGLLELAPPVDPAQLLADMPVGGVEDPHDRSPQASGCGGFSTNTDCRTMTSRIPGYGLSGPPRHPGAGGEGWEPSARMRAIPSQLRTQGWLEMDNSAENGPFQPRRPPGWIFATA